MQNDFVRNCIVQNGFVRNVLCNMSLGAKTFRLGVATPYILYKVPTLESQGFFLFLFYLFTRTQILVPYSYLN